MQRLHTAPDALEEPSRAQLDEALGRVADGCLEAFRNAWLEASKLTALLELARTLALRLSLVQNYSVDPTADLRALAAKLLAVLDAAGREKKLTVSDSEGAYLRGVLLLHAGERDEARLAFETALELATPESVEAIDYGSCLFVAHIAHEEGDWSDSIRFAERAAKLASSTNLVAQALAVVAASRWARGDRTRALRKFEDALRYFDRAEPLFNPYFCRNAILFCGIISVETGDLPAAEDCFRRALDVSSADSYDAFDARARLARCLLLQGRRDEAARQFEGALATSHFAESEPVVDVIFELGRLHADLGNADRARTLLQRVVTSETSHPGKAEASRLLRGSAIG